MEIDMGLQLYVLYGRRYVNPDRKKPFITVWFLAQAKSPKEKYEKLQMEKKLNFETLESVRRTPADFFYVSFFL